MSDFERRMAAFVEKVDRDCRAVLAGTVDRVHESVVDGSPLTGAPGQPVADGDLRDSWKKEVAGVEGRVFSRHPAAVVIETAVRAGRAITIQSPIGGSHSVALTVAGAGRLVEEAAQEVRGG